jgi:CRP-like cAMP-binding protein
MQDAAAWPVQTILGAPVLYPRGATLIRQGDPATSVFLVATGLIHLRAEGRRSSVTVGIESSGALVGAAAAVLGRPHPTSAVVLHEAEARAITAADLARLQASDARVAIWLARQFARENWRRVDRTIALASGRKSARLEWMIEELFRRAGERSRDGSMRLRVYLPVDSLAELSDTSRQWATHALAALARDGTVQREPAGWFLLPPESRILRRIVAGNVARR